MARLPRHHTPKTFFRATRDDNDLTAAPSRGTATDLSSMHGFYTADWRPVPDSEREAFAQALAAEKLKSQKEVTDNQTHPLNGLVLATIRRKAPRSTEPRALVLLKGRACDLVVIKMKRVTTPIRAK
ncbi:MAG: hypothetical protein ACRD22_04430 [Terriglobia bacterium]